MDQYSLLDESRKLALVKNKYLALMKEFASLPANTIKYFPIEEAEKIVHYLNKLNQDYFCLCPNCYNNSHFANHSPLPPELFLVVKKAQELIKKEVNS